MPHLHFFALAAALYVSAAAAQPISTTGAQERLACILKEEQHVQHNRARFDSLFRVAMESYRGAQPCLGVWAHNTAGPGASVCGKTAPHFVLSEIEEDSPASQSELREGDVLVSLNGAPVSYHLDFEVQVMQSKPGQRLAIEVEREGKVLQRSVTVGLVNIGPQSPLKCALGS